LPAAPLRCPPRHPTPHAPLPARSEQTKHILDKCEDAGHAKVTSIFVTGGLVKNPLYLQATADITGCVIEVPREPEAVLLGSAVLGARAGGEFPSVTAAMAAMNKVRGSRAAGAHKFVALCSTDGSGASLLSA